MKKLKILAGILAVCALVSITACDTSGNGDSGTPDVTTAPPLTTPPSAFEDEPEIETDKTIKYLGVYNPSEAGDIRAAYNEFRTVYGASMEFELCPDNQIMEKLASYITSGSSPDLVDQRKNTFPYFIGINMYEALDDYIDMNEPHWAVVKDYIDKMEVKGKHYYYPWAYVVSGNILMYDRARFGELGLDDPNELYLNGDWDWNAFKRLMTEFVDVQKPSLPDTIGVYGYISSACINSAGKAMIGYENGVLVNDVKSAEVDRAQTYLEELRKLKLTDYGGVVDEVMLLDGEAAFHAMGDWKFTDYAKRQNKNDDYDFMFVPFPRDPNADRYYLQFGMFAYMVPSGSKNIQLACDFMSCVRKSKTDPVLIEETKATILKEKKYTEEQYERWVYFQMIENFDPADLVMDFSEALDQPVVDDYITPMIVDICFDQSSEQMTWTSMRDSYYAAVDDNVTKMNGFIS